MKIVCYAFLNQDGLLESPFLEYLQKYAFHESDSAKKRDLKVKQLANIEAHLDYLLDHRGQYNIPPISQKYKNTKLGILKIKESKTLIRIAYFTKVGEKIVLLDVVNKPKLYMRSGIRRRWIK